MVRVWDKAPKQLQDIRKRVLREYAEGRIDKETLDTIEENINKLVEIIARLAEVV